MIFGHSFLIDEGPTAAVDKQVSRDADRLRIRRCQKED